MRRQISQKYELYKGATLIAESVSGFDILKQGQEVIEKYPDEHIFINMTVVYEEITTIMDNKVDRE
jgi:hypothetical protein